MNREAYLQELWGRLSNRMPRQELENVMRYYEEYFEEAGPQREAEVIAELGTPEHLAAQIMGDRKAEPQPEPQGFSEPSGAERVQGHMSGGRLALLICLSPIWLPLLLAVIIVLFAVVLTLTVGLFGILVGLGAGGVGLVACGIFSVLCGFSALFTPGIPTTIFFTGIGILAAGVGLLMIALCLVLGRAFGKAVTALWRGGCKGTAALCRGLGGRRQTEVAE